MSRWVSCPSVSDATLRSIAVFCQSHFGVGSASQPKTNRQSEQRTILGHPRQLGARDLRPVPAALHPIAGHHYPKAGGAGPRQWPWAPGAGGRHVRS